jgi:hypothetical protein
MTLTLSGRDTPLFVLDRNGRMAGLSSASLNGTGTTPAASSFFAASLAENAAGRSGRMSRIS